MAEPLRAAAAATARAAGLTLAITTITTLATGWLYWLRAATTAWPGPRIPDALPLDELPGHDGVPVLIYLAAFATAAALLGLTARALRLDRLTAGLALAATTWAWLLLTDAFCLLIVRQVPAAEALPGALRLQAIYLAAVLAGTGGAFLGRGARPGGGAAAMLAWLVAAGGLTDLLSAVVPRSGHTLWLVAPFAPEIVFRTAHVLLMSAGLLLVIISRGLLRRSGPAWRLAVGLLGLSVLLQLLRGQDHAAAIVTGLVTVALIARRGDFPFRGDPAAWAPALVRLVCLPGFAFAYGVTALWIHRMAAGLPFSFPAALLETLRAASGQLPGDFDLLSAEFGDWFPLSVMSVVAAGAVWAAGVWVRPWRQRFLPDAGRRELAVGIVRRWGADTLAPFVLRADKEWFIAGQTLVAFRVIRGVALVSGDPVGPPGEAGWALDGFLGYARARGWRVAVLGASGRLAGTYRERGLRPVYHGDEAVIEVAGFSLEGRAMRTVRQAAHRLARRGFSSEVVLAGEASPALRAELAAVERAWLGGTARKGFVMALDGLFCLEGDDALFVLGRDGKGRVNGFLHLAVCRAGRSLSLSAMPRWRDTPNGFTAWLITEALAWARGQGYGQLSLNFSPFAGLLAAGAELPPRQRLQRRALLRLKTVLALQLDNLHQFNDQFEPAWRPRYVVVQAWADLPRAALAAMAAEGYLPHARLIRGRDWPAPPPLPGNRRAAAPRPASLPLTRPGGGLRRGRDRPRRGLPQDAHLSNGI